MHSMKTFNTFLLLFSALLGLANATVADEIFTPEELASTYDIKDIDEKPVPVKQEEPVVTPALKNQKGRVYVAFIVSDSGEVANLRCVKTTSEDLTPVVLKAVENWKFKPGKVGEDRVAVRIVLPIRVDFS